MPLTNASDFGEIFEHSCEAYVMLDERGGFLSINKAAAKLLQTGLGTYRAEVSDTHKLNAMFADASRSGNWVPLRLTLAADDRTHEYSGRLRRLREDPHTCRYILCLTGDKEDREAFRSLRGEVLRAHARSADVEIAKKRLANVIDATRAGCWEWDIPSGDVWVNDYWRKMFGITDPDARFTSTSLREMCHPEDYEHARDAMLAHVRGDADVYEIEVRLRHADGRWLWIADKGRVVERDENGRPLTMAGTHIDITQRREHERALEEKRLEAEAANISKSQFLATMSHEIRTPMNGVMGMLDVVLNTELTLQQRDYLEIAQASAESLLHLLNDILNYSKLEAGAVELECLPYSPAEVVDDVADLLRSRAEEKGLELVVSKSADLDEMLDGDAARLRQVLINLVGNAIKFTDIGRVEMHAGMDTRPGTRQLAITVRDTGIGISEEVRPKLFNHFVQADSSTTRRFGGTGLGLVISKQLVELMQGDIEVSSTPGEGSAFTVTVPASYQSSDSHAGLIDGAEGNPAAGLPKLPPMRILVADDHPVNQQVIKLFLDACGHEVMVVENGNEVLKAVEEYRFDVILMDIEMPVLDGLAATAAIRARPGADRDTPIIAVTAHALSGDRERYLEAGMNGYVAKPFAPKELHAALQQVAEGTVRRTDPVHGFSRSA